jgi:hypothetical protein
MAIVATLAFIPFIGVAILNIAMIRPGSPRLSQVVETYMGRYPIIAAGLAGFVGALAGHIFWATGENPAKDFADLKLLPIALGIGIALGAFGAGVLTLVGSLLKPFTCSTPAAILGSPAASIKVGEQRTVCIHAHCVWNDAGIRVNKGEEYNFTGEGQWWDWIFPSGVSGYQPPKWSIFQTLLQRLRRVPTDPWFALSAQVLSEKGNSVAVAASEPLRVATDGRLTLFANDVRGFYWNNWGSVCVTVRRTA